MSPADLYRRYRHVARQFVKFGMVGGAGVLVNMVVAIVMNKLHGGTHHAQDILWSIPGTAYNLRFTSVVWIAGFLVANLFNFQFNRTWTFRDTEPAPWFAEFWPFLAVGSAAALIGLFVKIAFTNPTSPLYLPEPWFHDKPDAYAVCAAPTAAPTVALPAPYERCEGAEVGWASPPGGNELHFHYRAFSPAVTAARRAAAPGVCCYLIWEFPRSG